MERSGKVVLLVKDGNHEIDRHGDPDLGFDGIGTRSEVVLDAQVSLDPAEEEFDVPAHPVELGNGERRDVEVVGQENQVAARLCVEVAHLAKQTGIGCTSGGKLGLPDLVASQPGIWSTGRER